MILRDVIICLGDSLTFGSRDIIEGQGYPAILASLIEGETGKICICLNKGRAKDTSTDVLLRAYDDLLAYPEAQLVLLLVGTNDLKGTPQPEIFRNNIKQIVNIARVCNKKILVGTLPPIYSLGMWCFPHNVMDGVNQYNKVLAELSIEMDFPIVDFSDMKKYLIDGVHFRHRGYGEMARRWLTAIKEKL